MSEPSRPVFSEHDTEPVPGLPGPLPAGEVILWQGAPGFGGLARRALHLRWLSIYFLALALWRAVAVNAAGGDGLDVAQAVALVLLLGAVPVGLLALYGWATARHTLYTITSRRVVIRTGVALPLTVNVPFALIGRAGLAKHADGTGDIALEVMAPHRVSWIALWPHTRSWHVSKPQPTLRALPEPEKVAQILGRALALAAALPVRPVSARVEDRSAQPTAEAMA
ncbi:photosynthetic complex putative assembly protein PuhB [Falsiroseomonas oryzae]|uniref:photosynthetic complex putative assembly protein PuhB n=1 Tax=Falsiroseomonas oryzae TaxID=2766473 RepID=UPI0022EB91C2|nr:photosynthetic complex putative assembly protein PuhB [Roseomonas sp. MO-31]